MFNNVAGLDTPYVTSPLENTLGVSRFGNYQQYKQNQPPKQYKFDYYWVEEMWQEYLASGSYLKERVSYKSLIEEKL